MLIRYLTEFLYFMYCMLIFNQPIMSYLRQWHHSFLSWYCSLYLDISGSSLFKLDPTRILHKHCIMWYSFRKLSYHCIIHNIQYKDIHYLWIYCAGLERLNYILAMALTLVQPPLLQTNKHTSNIPIFQFLVKLYCQPVHHHDFLQFRERLCYIKLRKSVKLVQDPSVEIIGDHGRLLHSNVYRYLDHGSKLHCMEMIVMHCISQEPIQSVVHEDEIGTLTSISYCSLGLLTDIPLTGATRVNPGHSTRIARGLVRYKY